MARTKYIIDEKALTKGELRKLNALRTSIGDHLGNEAFCKWYEARLTENGSGKDPNIEVIENALAPHLDELRFPRGGAYMLKRGRGRIIVEAV